MNQIFSCEHAHLHIKSFITAKVHGILLSSYRGVALTKIPRTDRLTDCRTNWRISQKNIRSATRGYNNYFLYRMNGIDKGTHDWDYVLYTVHFFTSRKIYCLECVEWHLKLKLVFGSWNQWYILHIILTIVFGWCCLWNKNTKMPLILTYKKMVPKKSKF